MAQKVLERILYIEDDSSIAEVVQMTLVDFGEFDVLHCDRGQKALDAVERFNPDLVLMDAVMPNMDGLTTLSHMKEREVVKNIPVIFMTTQTQAHEQQEYFDAGAKGIVVKPFDPMTLCEQIESIWFSME